MAFKAFIKCVSPLLVISVLTACGGDSDSSETSSSSSSQQSSVDLQSYSLSGEVRGLDGDLALEVADQTINLSQSGTFEVADVVAQGGSVSVTIAQQPSDQVCAVSGATLFNNVNDNITDLVVECIDANANTVGVTVVDYFTGEPIVGAQVVASFEQGAQTQSSNAVTTGAQGWVEVDVGGLPERLVFAVDADSYAEQTRVVTQLSGSEIRHWTVQLLPVNTQARFSASDGAELTIDDVSLVSVPGSGFVDANGELYTGDVVAELTLIDPSSDPAIMPGNYETRDQTTGQIELIESYGALNATFTTAEGEALALAQGQQATVRIPVAEGASNPPATIPLYYFDDQSGYWVEEGEASLTTVSGITAYVGTVSHFTTWNADIVYDTVQVLGCVSDVTGAAVAGARVQSRGSSYIGTAYAYSDSNGEFSVPVRRDSQLYISATSAGLSRTLTIESDSSDFVMDSCIQVDEASANIVLSWGEDPADLDSYLTGPTGVDDERFVVSFYSDQVVVDQTTIFLDVDDISSFGPEIITIPEFPFAGVYRYGVHRYSGTGDIASSPARVQLTLGGNETVFSPPPGTATDCWAVFDLVVDVSGGVSVNPVNEWDSGYCGALGSGFGGASASRGDRALSLSKQATMEKYYVR